MGNFYTNFTVLQSSSSSVAQVARQLGRNAYVLQCKNGDVLLYDEACDEQSIADIEELGVALSSELKSPIVAAMNNDDDHLFLWVFRGGRRSAFYDSVVAAPVCAWHLTRARGGILAYPLAMVILIWPIILLQVWRHMALTNLLSLPQSEALLGYRYVSQGEFPAGYVSDDIDSV